MHDDNWTATLDATFARAARQARDETSPWPAAPPQHPASLPPLERQAMPATAGRPRRAALAGSVAMALAMAALLWSLFDVNPEPASTTASAQASQHRERGDRPSNRQRQAAVTAHGSSRDPR